MDTAVALVQAYLHLNGYFTLTEYPVIEAMRSGDYRTRTDLDVLAVRFPAAAYQVSRRGAVRNPQTENCLPDRSMGPSRRGKATNTRTGRHRPDFPASGDVPPNRGGVLKSHASPASTFPCHQYPDGCGRSKRSPICRNSWRARRRLPRV